ncbi:MAG: hypothetical protein P8Y23_09660 [Candidatus Lokiarchaeota archaeon]|jgi:flavodoxin
MKRALLIYEPANDHIRDVAMAISRGLEAGKVSVDTISTKDIDVEDVIYYDLIGFGCSTNFQGNPAQWKQFLNTVNSIKIEGKYGFVFETISDRKLTQSVGKEIISQFKRMKIKILHPVITESISNIEGSLDKKTFIRMEQVGLRISEKLNLVKIHEESTKSRILKYLKLILFGGGPIFFFIRAIQLASIGGDTFGTINPIGSWTLLLMEICFSGIAGVIASTSIFYDLIFKKDLIILNKLRAQKLLLIVGIISYILHFLRVIIWLSLIL